MCQVVSCHVAPLCQVVSCHVAPLCRCVRLCHVVWCDLVVIAIAFSPSPKIAPARAAMASSGLGLPATAASGQPLPSPAAASGGQPPAPGSTIACLSCAVSFVPRQAGQHACSASCRVKRKSALLKADHCCSRIRPQGPWLLPTDVREEPTFRKIALLRPMEARWQVCPSALQLAQGPLVHQKKGCFRGSGSPSIGISRDHLGHAVHWNSSHDHGRRDAAHDAVSFRVC